jgi:N-acyl-D-aspartate/D-glutamate deacylase
MAHDMVIRGGTVVDGTGSAGFSAEVAVDQGRITVVGSVEEPGRREIDARGALVTPGFVDLHTHYDAQVGWDPLLTSSIWHGVTTALLGNCGMTFAPVSPGGGRRLADMMETVEDIPAEAIMSALPWTWESYGDYLDFLAAQRTAANVAGLVGHCAVRYYVMGDDAVEEQPTVAQVEAMARIVDEALANGAAGFSTSRFLGHVLKDGRFVPGTFATVDELGAIADAIRGRGLVEAVLNMNDFDNDMALMTEVGRRSAAPVVITAVAVEEARRDGSTTGLKQPTPPVLEAAAAQGADVWASFLPRAGGGVAGLFGRFPWRTPAWTALARLSHDARLAAICDPAQRRALIDEANDAGEGIARRTFFMGNDVAHYGPDPDRRLDMLASASGETPPETFLRMAEDTAGRAMFSIVAFNRNQDVLRDMIRSPRVLPGLGDAGAHLAGVMDASYSTYVLSHWARDDGALTVEEAVRLLTGSPAALLGVADRGRVEVGLAADLNVIDLEALAALPVEPAYDAPLRSPRLVQRARGYRATIVNGEPITLGGVETGAAPGRLLRSFSRA